MTIRILLVDDSDEFLAAAELFVRYQPGLEIIGLANSGSKAIELSISLSPDLILMDWHMPGVNGLEATRAIKMRSEAPLILLFSLSDGQCYRATANDCADGFLSKANWSNELMPLVEQLFVMADK